MHPQVNSISGRLSLRPPQRESLEVLDRITEIAPPKKGANVGAALAAIQREFPSVTDFERDFPSLCFALATGVGKTRLMGAFISYLHMAHAMDNFFVLAPNLTIYKKLIDDFTPGTAKYVFKGIAAFATEPPEVITGDNYESRGPMLSDLVRCRVNIFNISKINSEVRGGRSPRIKRLSEYIGQSYFDYLAGLPDLVLLMDESHRYRASAGIRAINELKPVLGLELTATPFVETARGAIPFKNVIVDYPLGRAMADGFVKEPAVVTRKDFNPAGMAPAEIERLKLEDGVRLHEQTKVLLETYARENDLPIVKPFVLIIARDTTHAGQLVQLIKSNEFFEGRYADRVIQVDSSQTGAEEDEMVERLLRVENADEPTEIVVHVNMLKEGWDVTNLYTIVPLRAANARILIEQSIGRGLRLPYGKRTGVAAVDRLSIIAHDRFQELIDEANRPDSAIRLQSVVIDPDELGKQTRTVVAQSTLATRLGFRPEHPTTWTDVAGASEPPAFATPQEQRVAQVTFNVVRRLQNEPGEVPSASFLMRPDVQARVLREVAAEYRPEQLGLDGIHSEPELAAVVAKTTAMIVQQTIDIPRILVLPKGDVRSGFRPFALDLQALRYAAPSDEMLAQELRTGISELISLGRVGVDEQRLEDYVVSGLVDFDDVAYDNQADLLYDLAGQTVRHFRAYLTEEQTRAVLRQNQRPIATFVHLQMQHHYWEETSGHETKVRKGFTELKEMAFAQTEPTISYRVSPPDKSNMAKYLFGGFDRCLYPVAKFQSEPERILAGILERESEKWFKPAKGQFQIFYKSGADHLEYQPDFVAETNNRIVMLEPKRRSDMEDADVLAKRDAAVTWCGLASEHSATYGGKPWTYALIPHDAIATNMTIAGLVRQWRVQVQGLGHFSGDD
jgi:type III restriction enzyme